MVDKKGKELNAIPTADKEVSSVKETAADGSVSWVSFKPWQKNTVEWDNGFGVYASNNEVPSAATIHKLNNQTATSNVQHNVPNQNND